jgi:alpha-glucosidase (family GH31 glycosyl hydrolase)
MPLYVRAGAVVPFGPVVQYTDEIEQPPLDVVVYPGADGRFDLYEDDGRSFAYRRGEWMGITLGWSDATRRLAISLSPGSRKPPAPGRELRVRLAGGAQVRSMRFTGEPVTLSLAR